MIARKKGDGFVDPLPRSSSCVTIFAHDVFRNCDGIAIGWFSAVFAAFNTTNDDWIRGDENHDRSPIFYNFGGEFFLWLTSYSSCCYNSF